MIKIRNLEKQYHSPDGKCIVTLGVDILTIHPSQQIAITGPSGSGKSTLLSMIGGLVRPTSGTIVWNGEPWPGEHETLSMRQRAQRVGFVFQDLNLLPSMTLEGNLETAAWFLGISEIRQSVDHALSRVGLSERKGHRPEQLSRGERQRAAIARAILFPHKLILADEPTASLDAENAILVIDLLTEIAMENGSALLVATHDPLVMGKLPARFELQEHRIARKHMRDQPAEMSIR